MWGEKESGVWGEEEGGNSVSMSCLVEPISLGTGAYSFSGAE